MKQRDVDRLAWKNAAALVENMDLEQLYGDPETWQATEEQLDRAKSNVVRQCYQKAAKGAP